MRPIHRLVIKIPLFALIAAATLANTGCVAHNDTPAKECRELMDSSEMAYRKTDILTSMKCLDKARDIAHKHNLHVEYFNILNRMARDFVEIGDLPEAEHLIQESLSYSDTHLSNSYRIMGLNNLGILLTDNGQYDRAGELYKNIHRLSSSIGDSLSMAYASSNLSYIALQKNQLDLSLEYVDRALAELPDTMSQERPSILLGRIYCHIALGQPAKALHVADSISSIISPGTDKHVYDDLRHQYSRITMLQGRYDDALSFLSSSDDGHDELSDRIRKFKAYSEIYACKGDLQKAVAYKDSTIAALDSIHEVRRERERAYNQYRFNNTVLSGEIERKNLILGMLVILILLIMIIASLALRSSRLRRRKERLIAEQQAQIDKMHIDAAELEKRAYEEKLQSVNNELSLQAHNIITRNSLIQDTISYIKSLPYSNSHAAYLSRLRAQLINLEETEKVFGQLVNINAGFLARLHHAHPELTDADIKYLVMIYRRFSIKETAAILNISPEASKKRRQKIMAKMGLDSSVDLQGYLMRFSSGFSKDLSL